MRELRSHVRSETSPDSPMIAVTGTSEDRHRAADIANAVIEAVVVSSGHVSKDTGVKLIAFTHAMTPDEPVSPSVPLGTAVGAAAWSAGRPRAAGAAARGGVERLGAGPKLRRPGTPSPRTTGSRSDDGPPGGGWP